MMLQLGQSWVAGGICCSCIAVSLAVLTDQDINICPNGSFGVKVFSSPREGTQSRVQEAGDAKLRVEVSACPAKAITQA